MLFQSNTCYHSHFTMDSIVATIIDQVKTFKTEAEASGKCLVYPNQKEAADEAVKHLIEYKTPLVNLIAQPGVGKTGTFLEVAIQATTHAKPSSRVKISDLFIITGMSDTDWIRQTTSRMIPAFRSRVFHRNSLLAEAKRYTGRSFARKLIILDESHIATKPGMTIHAFIAALIGIKTLTSPITPDDLLENNISILAVSATPGVMLRFPMNHWLDKELHHVITIQPGKDYHGIEYMLENERLYDTDMLELGDPRTGFLEKLIRKMATWFGENRYHIFRCNTACGEDPFEIMSRMANTNPLMKGWKILHHDSKRRLLNIDTMLKTQPKQQTIIVIKGFWRASKRLSQDWVGITYETPSGRYTGRPNVSAIIQGLIGRFCDNSKPRWIADPTIKEPIHFTTMSAIYQYLEWIHTEYVSRDGASNTKYFLSKTYGEEDDDVL